MLSALLAVTMLVTPTCAADVQPGMVTFTLEGPVALAMLEIERDGRVWSEMPVLDGARQRVVWDTSALPPFAEVRYHWQGTRPDMSGFDCTGDVTLVDTTQAWQRASGPRATVWWYDEPVEYGLRALAAVEAQMARLETLLPGGLERARVVLYRTQADYGTERLSSGMALGRDTLVAWPCGGGDYLFEVTLPHEVTHLWTRAARRGMPEWFNEGLAVWSEPRDHAGEMALVEAGPPLTWEEMQRREFCTAEDQRRWYAQAYALVDYIDRKYDLTAIVGRLEAPHATLEDALRAEVGVNSAQVMQLWRIEQGFEARPRKPMHPDTLRWVVIGLHIVALAGLSWWRLKLRQADMMDDGGRSG